MADHKAEPVASSALIKVGGNNFASMTDASGINQLVAAAPAFHHNIDRALKANGKVPLADPIVAQAEYHSRSEAKRITTQKSFKRGTPVIHTPTGKKLTIIQASVGHTKTSLTPVHRVADKDGNQWDIKETKLKPRL